MSGKPVSELSEMLAGMQPMLRERPFRFVPHGPEEDFIDLLGTMFALIREDEGVTMIVQAKEDQPGPHFACITLQIDSSLEGVGLTAAVSTALAEEAIACNVVAGFHHDHLFVPWERRDHAMTVLKNLEKRFS